MGSSAWLLATPGAPRGGGGSDGCVLSGVTSSSRPRWQQPSTTLRQRVLGPCRTTFYGTRTLPGRGRSSTPCPWTPMWWVGGRPRPQERLQQRTVEQIVDPVPSVPLLHDVVPQMVEQLVDFLAPLDFRVAEQVTEVPKIVCPPRGARTVLCAPQMAEQLVEVPTEPGSALAVVVVQTLGWREAPALLGAACRQARAGYKYWPPRRWLRPWWTSL